MHANLKILDAVESRFWLDHKLVHKGDAAGRGKSSININKINPLNLYIRLSLTVSVSASLLTYCVENPVLYLLFTDAVPGIW